MSWWTNLFSCPCQGEKPGGLSLTDRAASFCGFAAGDRLLDVAAGDGSTVRHLRQQLGCHVTGLDNDPARTGGDVRLGEAECLPFPDGSFDGVFLECALSQMADRALVLRECSRVLKPGGKLVLSDLYARSGHSQPSTPLGRLDSEESLLQGLVDSSLSPVLFEDHSPALTSLWAAALMGGTGQELMGSLIRDASVKQAKCGYYLCVGEKAR